MKTILKRASFVLLLLALGTALAIVYVSHIDYREDVTLRRGSLANVSTESAGVDGAQQKHWVRIESTSGLTVNCGLLTPVPSGGRFPVIVLLGGKATGRHAIEYAGGLQGVIIAALDYPFDVPKSYTALKFISDVPRIRRGLLDVVPSVMLLTDYLWGRTDVDTARLVIVGYSFGAPFVPAVVAHDRRPAAVGLVYGGGELRSLIAHNVQRYRGPVLGTLAGFVGGLMLRPLEPTSYIGIVSPRPLIMINGTDDEQVPRVNAERLFHEAREPKRLIWLDSRHVNPGNVRLTRAIIDTLSNALKAVGILGEGEADRVRTEP